MARIAKSEHETIRHLVETEHRRVPEVAALYDCTPATIHGILARLRRDASAAGAVSRTEPDTPELPIDLVRASQPGPQTAANLFNVPVVAPMGPGGTVGAPMGVAPPAARAASPVQTVGGTVQSADTPADPVPAGSVTPFARRGTGKAGVGGKLAKPGCGLIMRTSDGEETLTPFRTVEDMLSAIKPILRTVARSPEPVWFSVQPIDLASVDSDAA